MSENKSSNADNKGNVDVNVYSESSSGSGHSGEHYSSHHHHHHRRSRKNKRTKRIIIALAAVTVLVIIIAVFASLSSGDDNSSQGNTSTSSESAKDSVKVYYVGSSKDSGKGYSFNSVTDAVNAWHNDSKFKEAVIIRNVVTSEKIYRVGSGRQYSTLKDAVRQWDADGQPTASILVDSGTYITTSDPNAGSDPLLVLPKNTNQLNIIGEDRDTTVVKSTTGKYIHPAIFIKNGNVTVKNITFIADHSTNPGFKYREKEGYNSAYAVHCDGGTVSGVVVFENCNMWSWQSSGLGSGTIMNSHIIVKNCDIRSFTEGYAVDPNPAFVSDAEEEKHAKFVHGSRGAIIYHSFAKADKTSNESFTLCDSYVYAKKCSNTVQILGRPVAEGKNDLQVVTYINNTFTNDFDVCNRVVVPSGVYLGANSTGNNLKNINSAKGNYALTIE